MSEQVKVEDIWVTTAEGAERTGYNREYVKKLVMRIARQPEGEREIKLRKRSFGYELWLPDLLAYSENRGPYGKRTA